MEDIRVYLINVEEVNLHEEHVSEISDERFYELAMEAGSVYSLEQFIIAFNCDTINSSSSYIRIF
jgi:hypothetical protein